MKQQVLDCFAKLFGGEGDIRTYFAHGRVNLIGEHTDYNGGHVFPCALTIGTYMAARKRDDRKLRFYSMNFEKLGVVESSLDEFLMRKRKGRSRSECFRRARYRSPALPGSPSGKMPTSFPSDMRYHGSVRHRHGQKGLCDLS